jgi:hypothetical protein
MKRTKGADQVLVMTTFVLTGVFWGIFMWGEWAYAVGRFASENIQLTLAHEDFGRFWYVGQRLLHAGSNTSAPITQLRLQFPTDILSIDRSPLQAWLYPPTTNLLAMAFALFPLGLSFWLWTAATLTVSGLILRCAGLRWRVIAMGLLSPADFFNFNHGQIGTLVGSILVACLLMMDTRPRLAGVLAGCLSFKPQVGLALFVILPQRWRAALPWAVLTFIGLVALSILFEGFGMWVWFFTVGGPIATRIISAPFNVPLAEAFISVFMTARSFGVGIVAADMLQLVSAVVSLALVAAAWRRKRSKLKLMAFTVCLTPLITPYGFAYDLSGFGVAMAAMFCVADDRRKWIFSILWLMSGFTFFSLYFVHHLFFPFFAAFGAFMCNPFAKPLTLPAAQPPLYAAGR